jgi:hypothetical protein
MGRNALPSQQWKCGGLQSRHRAAAATACPVSKPKAAWSCACIFTLRAVWCGGQFEGAAKPLQQLHASPHPAHPFESGHRGMEDSLRTQGHSLQWPHTSSESCGSCSQAGCLSHRLACPTEPVGDGMFAPTITQSNGMPRPRPDRLQFDRKGSPAGKRALQLLSQCEYVQVRGSSKQLSSSVLPMPLQALARFGGMHLCMGTLRLETNCFTVRCNAVPIAAMCSAMQYTCGPLSDKVWPPQRI